MPSSRLPDNRPPWPMKWIVFAILGFIVPYTWLTREYRKPGHAYEPYAEAKDRANTTRLLSAGWQRIDAQVEAITGTPPGFDPSGILRAKITEAAPGLPSALAGTLVESPVLAPQFSTVSAPSTAEAGALPYAVTFTCPLPDSGKQMSAAYLYVKDGSVVIVPQFESFPSGLSARSPEGMYLLKMPPGALKPGHYTVTLAAASRSSQWLLEVR